MITPTYLAICISSRSEYCLCQRVKPVSDPKTPFSSEAHFLYLFFGWRERKKQVKSQTHWESGARFLRTYRNYICTQKNRFAIYTVFNYSFRFEMVHQHCQYASLDFCDLFHTCWQADYVAALQSHHAAFFSIARPKGQNLHASNSERKQDVVRHICLFVSCSNQSSIYT